MVKETAQKVLNDNYVISPPIDIFDIANSYGFQINELDFGEEYNKVAGFITPKKRVIYINKNDSENRKKFSIAHELGHWLLHKKELETMPEKYAILLRIPLGQTENDPIEKEANCFAANLLVPKDMLDKHKGKDINEIAEIFAVSKDVIGFRMKFEYGN